MFRRTALAGALLLSVCGTAAGADEKLRSKLEEIGVNLATVMGAADYCGGNSQTLVDLMSRSYAHFKLDEKDARQIRTAIEARRQEARSQAAEKFSNQACPGDVRQKVNATLEELENMWYRVVQNETGLDMRQAPPASPPQATPNATGAASAPNAVPPGKYSCYTFDNGQLNYTYTDVQILQGGRYSVGNKGGNYTLSQDGGMRFTGTMSNATGRFSIKRGGKPQIDLVFNGDPRSSMSCPKAG